MARINSLLDVQARDLTGQALQPTLIDLVDLCVVARQARKVIARAAGPDVLARAER